MERLTARTEIGDVAYIKCRNDRKVFESARAAQYAVIYRLAAYEDINLTPEEITARLARLAEYDRQIKEGELVKVPCDLTSIDSKTKLSYEFEGDEWVINAEHIGRVLTKRKVSEFWIYDEKGGNQ